MKENPDGQAGGKVKFSLTALLFFLLPANLLAQATNDAPLPELPQSPAQYWDLAIGAITPLLVQLIKTLAPQIPKMALPMVTPLLGIGLGAGLNYLGATHLDWVDMAKAGALAVFIRETFNQAITKKFADPTP